MTEEASGQGGKKMDLSKFKWIFSSSFLATVFTVVYVSFAMSNLYGLMYPLTKISMEGVPKDEYIRPLWDTEEKLGMRVYLSTRPKHTADFFLTEFDFEEAKKPNDTVLLWKESVHGASLTKTFLISNLDCVDTEDSHGSPCNTADPSNNNNVPVDPSLTFAREWLDTQDQVSMADDGSILSTIQSAAGQGIESTSILLTVGQGIANKVNSFLHIIGLVDGSEEEETASRKGILERSNVHLPASSPIWSTLMKNRTIYVHVVLVRENYYNEKANMALKDLQKALNDVYSSKSVLNGNVNMLKHDTPTHLGKPKRVLLWDLGYLLRKYILRDQAVGRPTWEMEVTKPEYFRAYQILQKMKEDGKSYPYWKPEVAVKYLIDEDTYPMDYAHLSGMDFVAVPKSKRYPKGLAHVPALHVDEIGLTSDKYIPVNKTVTSLPLRISFDRSDLEDKQHGRASTATAGGISPARWRLLKHLSKSLESQRELGFEESDIDDLRRLIADTNVTLLGITVLASALHMLFEFLTFKSEISFWKNNSDLTGLSVRSLFLDMIGQCIIILYLIEQETSFLMTITSAFGILVALWKCQRAAGFALVRLSDEEKKIKPSWINILPGLFGYKFKARRLEALAEKSKSQQAKDNGKKGKKGSKENAESSGTDLQTLTLEADRQATVWLGSGLLPLVVGYTVYSLVKQEHVSWYSWLVTSASSGVYAFGFVLMTPQLFLNYKMKSVAHLPWRVLIYKSLNTFIDDLFSFIIRMPTMARISCFRDDVVFFIYLYQRWLYPVDASRPVEGGGEAESSSVSEATEVARNLQS